MDLIMHIIIALIFGVIIFLLILAMNQDAKLLVTRHKNMVNLREEAKTISSKEELVSFTNKFQILQQSGLPALDKAWLNGYLYAKTQEYYKDDE